ncbi:hypothetical protein [Streptomyces sp. NPDC088910]|uniref:hypothetical protein n=1 Tax=Streptomyces sp. NPDC088910 TaxID=3365911 RepID=UPI0037F5D0E0
MPEVGWTAEQHAGIKSYLRFAGIAAFFGVILSVVLICMGNSGGWILLAFLLCLALVAIPFFRKKFKEQPR